MSLWLGLACNMASVSFLTLMTLLFFPFLHQTTTQAEKVSFEWGALGFLAAENHAKSLDLRQDERAP